MKLKRIDKIRLENYANSLRLEQGVKPTDPIGIHQLLRKKNVIASFQPLSQGIEGMAVKLAGKDGKYKLFMLINTNSIYSRQRFTACHEMYHLLYQDDFTVSYDTDNTEHEDMEEHNADYFANSLLLPTEGLLMLIPHNELRKDSITLATILKLEQNFRCSRSCLLYKLKSLNLISSDCYNNFANNVIQSASEYGYDTSLYSPTQSRELIGDYNVKARELFDKGLISQAKYFSLLFDMGIDLRQGLEYGKDKGNIG